MTRRRGGFCYELNGLFAWLLEELGFEVALHSARVVSSGQLSPEFDHLVLSVELRERWIADVGFGDSSLVPLRVEQGQMREAGEYSIVEEAGVLTMVRRHEAVVEPLYRFTLVPHRLQEFESRCLFQQTSPESHFTQNTICSMATPSGRISIAGERLIVTSGGHRTERELGGGVDYRNRLRDGFGIELTDREVDRLRCPRL